MTKPGPHGGHGKCRKAHCQSGTRPLAESSTARPVHCLIRRYLAEECWSGLRDCSPTWWSSSNSATLPNIIAAIWRC